MSWLRIGLGVLVAGCRIQSLDLTGKACPCPTGWSCEAKTQTCVLGDADGGGDVIGRDADVVVPNLVYWFRLDESSGTVVADSSGHGGDGSVDLAHAVWMPNGGKHQGALHLDGTPYYGCMTFPPDCANAHAFSTAITVMGWFNFDHFQTAPYSLGDHAVAQGTSGGSEGAWAIGATDICSGSEVIGFGVTPSTSSSLRTTRCGTHTLVAGTWYYAAGVFDGATQTQHVYLNGMLDDGVLSGGQPPAALYEPPTCPRLACTANQMNVMAGSFDDVRIYDRALSADEILALYRASGG